MLTYPYHFVMTLPQDGVSEPLVRLYSFKSSRTSHSYIVRVEEYAHHFYGIKFYLKAHTNSEHKYNILTGFNDARPLICTCMTIMHDIALADMESSFGFIGSNSLGESKDYTKRFQVYSRFVNTFFSTEQFEHIMLPRYSAYLLLRRTEIVKDPELFEEISREFLERYQDFD